METNGESAAAIRSDRGGGTMVVDGGTYTSNGEGSPAVYCTADIAVKDATLTANGSEAVCIEGLNSLHLFDCDLTGNMSDLSQNDSTWTVTGDSTVSTLSNAGTIVDDSGKTVTIKGTDGTVYAEGDSDYTITVDKYEETADTSDSETIASWSDYEVEKPDTL